MSFFTCVLLLLEQCIVADLAEGWETCQDHLLADCTSGHHCKLLLSVASSPQCHITPTLLELSHHQFLTHLNITTLKYKNLVKY